MAYASFAFLVFLIFLFIAYFLTPGKYQWICLLSFSFLFYYFAVGVKGFFFILFTTTSVFYAAIILDKLNNKYKQQLGDISDKDERKRLKEVFTKKKRQVLAVGLLINFGILSVLKYSGFVIGNLNGVFNTDIAIKGIWLPLGISFYTFQTAGYLIDVYRGKYAADRNLAKFALFTSFFPQIAQGPIGRYDQLAHQLYSSHPFDYTRFTYGLQLILWGFFKKLIIADRAAIPVAYVNTHLQNCTGEQVVLGVFFYMVQIYCDFSGGIDISRGIAQVCGIELAQNFQQPYFAKSIAEHWRRWHISLGTWMKDYLLYPISLSKTFAKLGKKTRKVFGAEWGKAIPACIAMVIVFLVVGIWHGAAWKYVAFGLYNGVLISLGILTVPVLTRWNEKFRLVNTSSAYWGIVKILGTLFLVFVGKIIATAVSLKQAFHMAKAIFTDTYPQPLFRAIYAMGLNVYMLVPFMVGVFILFAVDILQERGWKLREVIARQNIIIRWAIYFAAIFSVLIFGMYGTDMMQGFIYENF